MSDEAIIDDRDYDYKGEGMLNEDDKTCYEGR
jgi:hypothetical protein